MMPETLTLADLLVTAALLWISGAVAGFASARALNPPPPEPLPDIHTVAERDARAVHPPIHRPLQHDLTKT